ncbi:MAG: flagellar filament capping protein FliD [Treponema sp.]|jgi:flagellar hook-associated protein 2|nr:flagellar filament capping protein FliD [Treponema sp.]
MSDVYIPGVKSRFNSEKLIEDLMKVERVPRERTEKNIENLETHKGYWQEVGRRITTLRDSARHLYSFQNPFNERTALSSDDLIISAAATREAAERNYRFTVQQVAQADRFLSPPLDEKYKIESGTYTFSVGTDEITFNFRGGTLKEFADALNRRGRDKINASLIAVQPGTKSFLIESKITGAENRMGFSGDAAALMVRMGIAEQTNESRRNIVISEGTVRENAPAPGVTPPERGISVQDGVLEVPARASASIPMGLAVPDGSPLVLKLETSIKHKAAEILEIPQPPPGPSVPSSGSISYGGIVIENSPSAAPLPEWKPPPIPPRVDNLSILSVSFSDGSRAALAPVVDTGNFFARQYRLSDIAAGKTITAINISNNNTHRDILVKGAVVFDPNAISGGYKPLNAVSTAQDAVISMEGIEMTRSSNTISDIIPGVTVTVRGVSERPVELKVQPDREAVKNAVISMVGNYNRLMAELNVLTRADGRLVDELTYLNADEAAEMRKRLGVFSGDSTLLQFRSNLQRSVSAIYPTSENRDLAMLSQLGISTNTRSSGGMSYDPARLRGYLEIDEKSLEAAMETKFNAIRELFGSDTDGDLIVDTGVAYNVESLSKPFVETGGIIALKTGTIDSKIGQDKRRIDSMERQLAAKEADLKIQYGKMESAYARMEQMSSSFDNFNQQNGGNR